MKMSEEHEIKVLKEIIEIYRSQSCLWDTKSSDYKCTKKRNMAWGILLGKYREIDPDADMTAIKRKIDNMKGCYQRELRKVNKSILEGSSKEDIHEPTLWYFKMLSFLTKSEHSLDPEHCKGNENEHDQDYDEQQNDGVYMLIVDDNYEPPKRPIPPKPKVSEIKTEVPESKPKAKEVKYKEKLSQEKQLEITHYTKELKRSIQNTPKGDHEKAKLHKINPFAVYIGKQLEDMSAFQRKVAEKVISEVIFLGITDSLSLDSRVETAPRSSNIASCPPRSKESPKPKTKTAKKRKLSPENVPARLTKTAPMPRPKRKAAQKTQFLQVEVEECPTLLIPRLHTNPLSTTDCSSDSDSSIFEVPHREVDTPNSSESDVSENDEDTSIKEDDSILMTLLKTK